MLAFFNRCFDRSSSLYRGFFFVFAAVLSVVMGITFMDPLAVKADDIEDQVYSYHLSYYLNQTYHGEPVKRSYEVDILTSEPLAFFLEADCTTYISYRLFSLSGNFVDANIVCDTSGADVSHVVYTETWIGGGSGQSVCALNLSTNIPIFSSKDEVDLYFETGDFSGALNASDLMPDLDDMDSVRDFYLVNFSGSVLTGLGNRVSAKWSGLSLPVEQGYIRVHYDWALKSNPDKYLDLPSTHDVDLNITDRSFSSNFSVSNDDDLYFLRRVSFTPVSTESGNIKKGASSFIYLNPDGSVSFVSTASSVDENNNLSLMGVKWKKGSLSNQFNMITWTGVSGWPANVPVEDTFIMAYMKLYDTETLEFTDIPIPRNPNLVDYGDELNFESRYLNINTNYLLDYEDTLPSNQILDSKIYLQPCYKDKSGKLIMGKRSVVNFLDGTVEEEYWDYDEGQKVTTDLTVPEATTDFDINLSNYLQYTNTFISFLKSVVGGMGSFPSLFATVFSFLPSVYINAIGFLFVLILLLRILGR